MVDLALHPVVVVDGHRPGGAWRLAGASGVREASRLGVVVDGHRPGGAWRLAGALDGRAVSRPVGVVDGRRLGGAWRLVGASGVPSAVLHLG